MCSEEAIVAFGKTICETVSRGEAYLFDTKDKKILENHLDRFLIGLIRAVEIDDSRMAIKIKMGSVAFHALELLGSFGGASIGLAHGNEQQQAAGIMAAFFGNKSYEWLIDEILDKAAGHIRCSRPELCEFGSRVFSLVYKLETYKFEHSEVAKKDCLITFLKTLIFLSGVKDNPYVTTSQLKAA
jgi:hypothetical protein